ncbi:hypothetical protein [Streptomyces sp. NPDC001652]|uniref:hypothetical protein n=1 Tax=Streptomyces sp. NPDC001652 TaxID=3154393 RepID=UPI0033210D38
MPTPIADNQAGPWSAQTRSGRAARPISPMLAGALTAVAILSLGADSYNAADGQLSARTTGGRVVVGEPNSHPWSASFGSFVLCSTTGRKIILSRIRYETPVAPLSVSLQLRRVDSTAHTVSSAVGEPPSFRNPGTGVNNPVWGDYTSFREGAQITQTCSESKEGSQGFTELFFVMRVDERGGVISRAWVDYTVDGLGQRQFTLPINWEMTACGSRVRTRAPDSYCWPR